MGVETRVLGFLGSTTGLPPWTVSIDFYATNVELKYYIFKNVFKLLFYMYGCFA